MGDLKKVVLDNLLTLKIALKTFNSEYNWEIWLVKSRIEPNLVSLAKA